MKYEEIVNTYYQPLYWHIRRMVVNHDDAQDILQDTFLKIYRHHWTLSKPDAVRGWAFRIAGRETIRFLDRKRKALGTAAFEAEMLENLKDSAQVDFRAVEALALQRAMVHLSPLQKQVFCLRYYDEMDYGEISRITGSGTDSLKTSYHKAKKIIEEYVRQQ